MKLSIVVPAYNEEKLLGATLQSIHAAAQALIHAGWEYEIVVCDNNSTDRTAGVAGENGARVVFESVNQISRARNTGAKAATGEWLLFVDADSQPTRELLADVVNAIGRGNCLAGGSTVRLEGPLHPLAQLLMHFWNGLSRWRSWVAGSFIFCQTAAFWTLGGFSEELFASEEIELSRRLKRMSRHRGKRVLILHEHPLLTSARKLHLYSTWEYLRFTFRMVLGLGRPLRSRDACHPWYDGRR